MTLETTGDYCCYPVPVLMRVELVHVDLLETAPGGWVIVARSLKG